MTADNLKRVTDTLNLVTGKLIADKDYAYTTGYLQSLLAETIEKYVEKDSELMAIQTRLLAILGVDVCDPEI